MASTSENYERLNKALGDRSKMIFSSDVVTTIDFNTTLPFVREYQEKIEEAALLYEPEYQEGYHGPLETHLSSIIGDLKEPIDREDVSSGIDPVRYAFLTLLVNAALQRSVAGLKKPLSILQEILTDQFNSYLLARARLNIKSPLTHHLPPLIGFTGLLPDRVSKLPPLPTTLEMSFLRQYLKRSVANHFKAGAIGMPAGHKQLPILWGLVGHEGGGHYVLTADDKVIPELHKCCYEMMLRTFQGETGHALAALWRYWTEEAASDVCGVLHLGPSAGIGALSWYTALFPLAWKGKFDDRLTGAYSPNNWHPVSIVIPDLLRGAIEQLSGLAPSRRSRYEEQMLEIAEAHSEKISEVRFGNKAYVPDPAAPEDSSKFTRLPDQLPLEIMRESARTIGRLIATVRLASLEQNTLQDIASWTNNHEEASLTIADRMTEPKTLLEARIDGRRPTAVELISGGVLAVVRKPDRFDEVNRLLLEAFNDY